MVAIEIANHLQPVNIGYRICCVQEIYVLPIVTYIRVVPIAAGFCYLVFQVEIASGLLDYL